MVEIGIKGRQETVVTMANVATNVGSGKVRVFATPMMIALMEKTAVLSIEPFLEEGQSSVGMSVWAESEVIEVDRRRVTFAVRAYDERGLIGEGTHDRFIIDVEKFQSKAESK